MDFSGIVTFIVPTIGIVISAIVSWKVAKIAADKEIVKLKMQWAYEKSSKYEESFINMVEYITYYITYHRMAEIGHARQAVAEARVIFSGELGKSIDELYDVLNPSSALSDVEAALNKVIETKRNSKT